MDPRATRDAARLVDEAASFPINNSVGIYLYKRVTSNTYFKYDLLNISICFSNLNAVHGAAREGRILIDFIGDAAGGPIHGTGRDLTPPHEGMGMSESDWSRFSGHAAAPPGALSAGEPGRGGVPGFIESQKGDIAGGKE